VLAFAVPLKKGRVVIRPFGYRKVFLTAFTNGSKLRNMHTLCQIYRRQIKKCRFQAGKSTNGNRRTNNCRCPIWVDG
jgi:hypothetical protein